VAKQRRAGTTGRGAPPPRIIQVQPEALEDLRHWMKEDRRIALKVLDLIEAARRNPFDGLGKPEPVKHLGADTWSRRITQEDRLVYRITDTHIDILQARYHY
jgi:toxin YoeB